MSKINASSILLTYKGKILLMHRDDSPIVQTAWCLIEEEKENTTSFEEAIITKVEEETGIKLIAVKLLTSSTSEDIKKYFYHAELTDNDVNNIKRDDGQTLEFFTLPEIEKLSLTISSKAFFDFLEEVPN